MNLLLSSVANSVALSKSKMDAPIGAVVVLEGKIISSGYNAVESLSDPLAHAEIMAIQMACRVLSSTRLFGCEIFVSLEPCPMCAYAIALAKISRLHINFQNTISGGVINGPMIYNYSGFSPEIIFSNQKQINRDLHYFFDAVRRAKK